MTARVRRPLIVVGAPRSGTTLLFSILSSHPDLWSSYREPEAIFARRFHPAVHRWSRGNVLEREDLSDDVADELRRDYYDRSHNLQALLSSWRSPIYRNPVRERVRELFSRTIVSPLLKPESIRIVEKNPKHCFRIPFLSALFPDATFVLLTRNPRENIASLMEGWTTRGEFETYSPPIELDIEGYDGSKWNFLLPPGWTSMARGHRLSDVCAFQYQRANEYALRSLDSLGEGAWVKVSFENLVSRPTVTMRRLSAELDLSYEGGLKRMSETLPPMNTTSEPDPDKWRRHEEEIESVLPKVTAVAERLGYPDGDNR